VADEPEIPESDTLNLWAAIHRYAVACGGDPRTLADSGPTDDVDARLAELLLPLEQRARAAETRVGS
jgi:hypothetical protein